MADEEISLGLLMEIRQQGAEIVEQVIQFFEGAKAAATGASAEATASAATQTAANAEVAASAEAVGAAATEAAAAVSTAAAEGAAAVTASDEEMTAANAETAGSMDTLSESFGRGGLAMAAAVGVAAVAVTGMALEWQDTMTSLANATQEPEEAVQEIGNAMGTLSDRVTFSESALSGALSGVAGQWQQYTGAALSAESATGLMSQAAQLAMVSHGQLNNVTQDLVQTMIAFKVPAEDAATVSDTLYNTSRLTGSSVDDLSQSMDRLKGRLGEASPSLNDVATLTDTLAQNGISGSRGIMTVSSAFTTLLGQNKSVTDELSALGVNIFDSSGKFIGMKGVIQELGPVMAGMTEQQQDYALKQLFGASAGSIMATVIKDGTTAWDKNSAAVSQAGTVQAGYQNIQADTLTQLDEFKNRAEVLARELGDDLLGQVYNLINAVQPYAEMVRGFLQDHQQLAQILVVVAAAVGATALAFGVASAATLVLSAATTVLGAVLGAAFLPVTLAVVAAVVLGYEAYQHWDQIIAAFHVTVAALTTAFQDAVAWLENVYKNSQQLQDIWAGLQKAGADLATGAATAWKAIQQDVSDATTKVQAGLQALYKLWDADGPAAVTALETAVRNVFDAIERFIDGGMQAFQASFSAGWATIQDVVQTAMDIIETTIRVQWDLVSGTVTTVINTLSTLISTQFNAWKDIIEGVMNLISDLIHGRWSDVASDLKQILDGIGEVFTGLWQTLLTFLQGIIPTFAQAARDLIQGMINVIHDYLNAFEDSFNALLSGAEGAVEGFVSVFSDAGGKIITGLISGIQAELGNLIAAAANVGKSMLNAVKDGAGALWPFSPSVAGRNIAKGLAEGITVETPGVVAAATAMAQQAAGAAASAAKESAANTMNELRQALANTPSGQAATLASTAVSSASTASSMTSLFDQNAAGLSGLALDQFKANAAAQAYIMAQQGFGANGLATSLDQGSNPLAFQAGYNTGPLTGAAAAVAQANANGGMVGTVIVNVGGVTAVDAQAAADIISQQLTQHVLASGRI